MRMMDGPRGPPAPVVPGSPGAGGRGGAGAELAMHIRDVFARDPTTFSFEFFPPKTAEAAQQLFEAVADLRALRPSFVSVTYGAGGSTRELTHEVVERIGRETTLMPVPHLTCVRHDEPEIRRILERYCAAGIRTVLALRGDDPRGAEPHDRSRDAFRYAADLVAYVRRFGPSEPPPGGAPWTGFGVGVAGYPEGHPATPNRVRELEHLKAKVDAGADFVVTQLFFDNRDFYDFRERCELAGIRVPILAGIMPVTSLPGMMKMADMALGARFPAPLLRAVNRTGGDPDAVRRVGVHWATEQCRDLLDHQVRGIHLYTLNRSTATKEIYLNLGVKDSRGLM